MQSVRGSIGTSFIPKIRKTRKMDQGVIWARDRGGESVPKARTGTDQHPLLTSVKRTDESWKALNALIWILRSMGIEELREILEGRWEGYGQRHVLTRPLWKKLGTWALPASMRLLGLVQEAWGRGAASEKPTNHSPMGDYQKSDFPSFWQIWWKPQAGGQLEGHHGCGPWEKIVQSRDALGLGRSLREPGCFKGGLSHLCQVVQTTSKLWNDIHHSTREDHARNF